MSVLSRCFQPWASRFHCFVWWFVFLSIGSWTMFHREICYSSGAMQCVSLLLSWLERFVCIDYGFSANALHRICIYITMTGTGKLARGRKLTEVVFESEVWCAVLRLGSTPWEQSALLRFVAFLRHAPSAATRCAHALNSEETCIYIYICMSGVLICVCVCMHVGRVY